MQIINEYIKENQQNLSTNPNGNNKKNLIFQTNSTNNSQGGAVPDPYNTNSQLSMMNPKTQNQISMNVTTTGSFFEPRL